MRIWMLAALAAAMPCPAAAQGQPVRSLDSSDYSDLAPLRKAIGSTRIVLLGESSHGVGDYHRIKARLVRFLHDEMGFTLLAFESPMFGCAAANRLRSAADPAQLVRACLWAVWHTDEQVELMRTVQARAATLHIAGIDSQPGGGDRPARLAFLRAMMKPGDVAYGNSVEALENRFWELRNGQSKQAHKHETFGADWRKLAADYARLAAYYRERIQWVQSDRATELLFAAQIAQTTGRHIEAVSTADAVASAEVRDRAMAENLRFLAETIYPGQKIIVIAHNSHIARANERIDYGPDNFPGFRALGGNLAAQGIEAYRLALFARRGEMANNSRRVAPVTPIVPGSLEALPMPSGAVALFLDIAHDKAAAKALAGLTAKEWGKDDVAMDLPRQFEGVLLLDAVTPPAYRSDLPRYDAATVPLP